MLLNGIFPAITTPYYADGSLYLKKLEHNVDRYSKGPIAGMVVLGSTGEAVLLNCEEQREVFVTAIAAAAPEKVMIAGCGHESVQETSEACEYAASLGYDAAMVRTPHYYRAQMTPPVDAQLLTALWPTVRRCQSCSTTFLSAPATICPSN